jgi:hypothetical protein
MRFLTAGVLGNPKVTMPKTLLAIVWLSVFSLIDCKPTSAGDKSSEGLDSPVVERPLNTGGSVPLSTESDSGNSATVVTIPIIERPAREDTSAGTPDFQCTPKIASSRDTITLRMTIPHGEYLLVTQPNGTTFFLVYPHPAPPAVTVLTSSDAFPQMPTIRFGTDLKSTPQVFGRDTLERVFREPGNYVVEIGHNLESERAAAIHKCTVQFAPER